MIRHNQNVSLPNPDDGVVGPADESNRVRKQSRRRVKRVEGAVVLEEQTIEFTERTVVWNVGEASKCINQS